MSKPFEDPTSSTENNQEQFEKIARENFATWNQALLTKDPAKVAELYTADNTFLPTVSGEFKKGHKGATDYFHHFLEKNPEGKIITEKVTAVSADTYLHSGEYDFEVDTPDKKGRTIVHADFTYVWKKNQAGDWQILHHHSSAKSEKKITQNFLQGKISEEETQELSPEANLRSGFYTYTADGKTIEARFTSLWQNGELTYQHLSERPKG